MGLSAKDERERTHKGRVDGRKQRRSASKEEAGSKDVKPSREGWIEPARAANGRGRGGRRAALADGRRVGRHKRTLTSEVDDAEQVYSSRLVDVEVGRRNRALISAMSGEKERGSKRPKAV